MQYFSTRDSELRVSAQEAIVRGLAPQSGLFVPETFPKADLEGWKNLSYPELAEKVLAGFLTDYSADFLHNATAATYGERLEIHTTVEEWRGKVFIQHHRVLRGDELICEGRETRALCLRDPGGRLKAIPVPDFIRAACA